MNPAAAGKTHLEEANARATLCVILIFAEPVPKTNLDVVFVIVSLLLSPLLSTKPFNKHLGCGLGGEGAWVQAHVAWFTESRHPLVLEAQQQPCLSFPSI